MIGAESELASGTKHSLGDRAANLPLLQLQSAGQSRTHRSERIEGPDRDVGRTANHVRQLSASGVNLRDPEVIGVGMRHRFDDAADDDLA